MEAANIPVWRDRSNLWPGEDWRLNIRRAITDNALVFIACFSSVSVARSKSYQNEEITLAVEQLRQRRPEDPWLIPVRFDECDIPDIDLGAGRTLSAIHCEDLFGGRYNEGVERLVAAISRLLGQPSSPRTSVRAAVPSPIKSTESGQRRGGRRRIPAWALAVGLLVAVVCVSTALWLSISSAPPATLAVCASGASGPSVPAKIGAVTTGSGEFVSVALSPDCQFLATGGNGDVELWRIADSRQVATLPSSSFGNVYELAFSYDGKVLAAAGQDGTVSLWDVADRRRIAILDATPNGATYCVSFSSVGDTVATGGSDGVARLWNAANGRQIGNGIITGSPVGALALSPNGKVLAVGGADGIDRLWDVATRRQIAVLSGRQGQWPCLNVLCDIVTVLWLMMVLRVCRRTGGCRTGSRSGC